MSIGKGSTSLSVVRGRVSCRGVIICGVSEQMSGMIGGWSGHGSLDASCVGDGVVDIFRH